MRLSPRQREILTLVASGMTDKTIALRLGVSQRTVRTHLERIYAENRLHSRAAAVAAWMSAQPDGRLLLADGAVSVELPT
jgi:DNA-binding CsgD family transcriptional regulator